MNWGVVGAVMGGLGVAVGAFGAHALKDRMTGEQTGWYETGVLYHFVHALALLAVAALAKAGYEHATRAGTWFALGIVLFSGSLYAMALGGPTKLGAVTPLGGLAFLVGWGMLALSLREGA